MSKRQEPAVVKDMNNRLNQLYGLPADLDDFNVKSRYEKELLQRAQSLGIDTTKYRGNLTHNDRGNLTHNDILEILENIKRVLRELELDKTPAQQAAAENAKIRLDAAIQAQEQFNKSAAAEESQTKNKPPPPPPKIQTKKKKKSWYMFNCRGTRKAQCRRKAIRRPSKASRLRPNKASRRRPSKASRRKANRRTRK